MKAASGPIRRLATYWKIEAINVVLIPAIALYFVLRSGGRISAAFVLSALACSFLLVIGTIVLRMMHRRACGETDDARSPIPLLIRLRWPAVALCTAAAVAMGIECVTQGPRLASELVAPAVLLLLAVLEYVNYYHVQLQHFNHAPDWQRLISGRGFRRSHLAREIECWKRERPRGA
jgi:hypothetical protein